MQRLFIYGTLNPEQAPAELEEVLAKFVPLGEAKVRGRLYQLQEYPGLVLDASAGEVSGKLFELPDDLWPRLDAYEGYDPEVEESSLFLRVQTEADRSDGTRETVWVYVYNRHTDE